MKNNLNDITKEDFRKALETLWEGEITTIAPMGYKSNDVYLYNNPTPKENGKGTIPWSGCVLMNMWCDIPTLLIGNKAGKWLTKLKIDRVMGFDYILNEFYRSFKNVKHLIDREDRVDHEAKVIENVEFTVGFEIIERALKTVDESTVYGNDCPGGKCEM